MNNIDNRLIGCFVGLAIGDALGTTLEFCSKGSFEPIDDIVGGGPFDLEPGQWTDDTSMALCLAQSLVYCDGFNAQDQMNRYCNWWQYGYMSSTGSCFDIGATVSHALQRYLQDGNPFSGSIEPESSGNGSLMRIAPISIYYRNDLDLLLKYAGESSRTTHGSEACIDACRYFCTVLKAAFFSEDKDTIFSKNNYVPESQKVRQIASLDFFSKTHSQIRGSGYVVDCLEAALWCFVHSHSFEEAVLKAANLGDDADTTAAVCGQISGAFYGIEGIPKTWVERLWWTEEIQKLGKELIEASS